MGQIVSTKDKTKQLGQLVSTYERQLESLLPKHLSPARMMRVVMNAAIGMPRLLEPELRPSFIAAMLEAASLGLEPGVAGQCWILPYGKKAVFIPGYRGLVQLARRSKDLTSIFARCVWEGDNWSHQDFPPSMVHVIKRNPDGSVPEDRGEITRAYAAVQFAATGHWQYEVMERFELDTIRKSSASAAKPESPWNRYTEMMFRKCPLRRMFKVMPMAIDDRYQLERAVELDEKAEAGIDQELEAEWEVDPEKIDWDVDPEGSEQ